MDENIKKAINGIYYQYAGERLQVLADLGILLEHPQGVGDHAVHSKDIREKLEKLEHLNSMLDTINEEYGDITMPDKTKPTETTSETCCDDESCDCE